MFEILVIVFIASLYSAMLLNLFLWVYRLRLTLKENYPLKDTLFILLTPGSMGYFHRVNNVPKWYRLALVVMFVLVCMGSVYLAFLNIPAFAHWFFYSL